MEICKSYSLLSLEYVYVKIIMKTLLLHKCANEGLNGMDICKSYHLLLHEYVYVTTIIRRP